MSTRTLNIHELAAVVRRSESTILKGRITKNGKTPHPLYIKGFKVGDGSSSPLLWFQDDVDEFLESKRSTSESDRSDMHC